MVFYKRQKEPTASTIRTAYNNYTERQEQRKNQREINQTSYKAAMKKRTNEYQELQKGASPAISGSIFYRRVYEEKYPKKDKKR